MAVVRHRGPGTGGGGGGGGGGRSATSPGAASGEAAKASPGRVALPSAALVAWLLLLVLGVLAAPLYLAWAQMEETRETAQRAADASAELALRVREMVTRLESHAAQLEPLREEAGATRRDLKEAVARNDAAGRAAGEALASLERRLAVDMAASTRALRQDVAEAEAARAQGYDELRAEFDAAIAAAAGRDDERRDDELRLRLEELSSAVESLRSSEQASSNRLDLLDSAAAAALSELRSLDERASSLASADAERCRASAEASLTASLDASRSIEALRRETEAAGARRDEARAQAEAAAEKARRDLDGLQRLADNHEARLAEVAEAVTALERLPDAGGARRDEEAEEAAREQLRRLEERVAAAERTRAAGDGSTEEAEELRAAVGDAVERARAAEGRWREAAEAAGDAGRLREMVRDAVAAAEGRLVTELEARIAAEVAAAAATADDERKRAPDGGEDEHEEGDSIGSLREELLRMESQLAEVQRALLEGGGGGGSKAQ